MNRIDFEDMLADALMDICPSFSLGMDNNGQIVLYTQMTEDEEGEIIPFDASEQQDFDAYFQALKDSEDHESE